MNTTKRARVRLILSMAAFGTLAPFVRNISVSSGELALYRAILAVALIGTFLVATAEDMKTLLTQVSDIVYDKFGIRLEPEVRIW